MENINVTVGNNNETIFNGDITSIEEDECSVLDINTTFSNKNLMGWYREQVFEAFKIGYGVLQVTNKCKINFALQAQSIEMFFALEGNYLIHIDGMPFNNYFEPNNHNIIYYTNAKGAFEIKKGRLSLIRINFSIDFLKQFLPQGKKFKDFRKQIKKNKTGKLNRSNYPITPSMHFIIKEIWHSKRTGFFRKMHMNAMVLELLLLQLDQSNTTNQSSLSILEEEKILKIKDYITQHYTQPLTLQLLSKKFGTNDFALKKGFKAIFGMTVFGYIVDLKMNKAKELLIDKRLPVGEVSEIVGYKNPQHFSTAFKKKFGVTPSKLN